MAEHDRILTLENFYMHAWVAFETLPYDGWLLRFADGYTRRANSVNPLYSSSLPLQEKLAFCERTFAESGISLVYKLTDAAHPADLDAQLEARGYTRDDTVSVQLSDLTAKKPILSDQVFYSERLTDDWLDDFCRLNIVAESHLPPMRRLLDAILLDTCFMTLKQGRQTVAVGLGVCDGQTVGLFDIVTSPQHRRQGFGAALVESLLHWAKAKGAEQATLQVVRENQPARALYENFGFKEVYTYWYRNPPK